MFCKFCTSMNFVTIVVLSASVLFPRISSFSVGVPQLRSTCRSMTPRHHHYPPQNTAPPFQILVDRNVIFGGAQMVVTVMSRKSEEDAQQEATYFKGFYIQVRSIEDTADSDKPLGGWVGDQNGKVHSCNGKRANAIYHASGKTKKDNVTLIWNAPKTYNGEIVVTATIVKDFVTYWIFVESNPIRLVKAQPTKKYLSNLHVAQNSSKILSSKYMAKSEDAYYNYNDNAYPVENTNHQGGVCDHHHIIQKLLGILFHKKFSDNWVKY